MATYDEILTIASAQDSTTAALRRRVQVAVVVACEAIRAESAGATNHAARVAWAGRVMENPGAWVDRALWAVLAQNSGAAAAAITGASDATVQAAVNNAVNLLAGGVS